MTHQKRNFVILAIWMLLLGEILFSAFVGRWSTMFTASLALTLSFMPFVFANRLHINIPTGFLAWVVVFVFATIFLGEAFDFYERFWWWDVLLHGGSAIGFGLIGFVFIFMMFQGDRYAAPPLAMAVIAFCVAISIGVVWEVFEFAMDQFFGMNMQKSGLVDTMWDLIVDTIGAGIGAMGGYFYLRGESSGGLSAMISEFVQQNRRLFRKIGRTPPKGK